MLAVYLYIISVPYSTDSFFQKKKKKKCIRWMNIERFFLFYITKSTFDVLVTFCVGGLH
jgi:hypothetical protein